MAFSLVPSVLCLLGGRQRTALVWLALLGGLHQHDGPEPDSTEQIAADGISAEVVDLRTLVPLDREAVLRSVAKTGRLLVADEDYLHFGVSGEIPVLVAEQIGYIRMKAPVKRLGVPNVPIPYSRPLEQAVIPQVADIAASLRLLVS